MDMPNNVLDIPLTNAVAYGTSSCKMRCKKDWNKFQKYVTKLNHGKLLYVKANSYFRQSRLALQEILKLKFSKYIEIFSS